MILAQMFRFFIALFMSNPYSFFAFILGGKSHLKKNPFPRKVSFNFRLKEACFSVWRVNCKLFRMTKLKKVLKLIFHLIEVIGMRAR